MKFLAKRTPPPARSGEMTLLEHLSELRNRIVAIALALLTGFIVGLYFAEGVLKYLSNPYQGKLIVLGPTEGITMYFRVALTVGAAAASPVVVYQILAFVNPGLEQRERRWMWFVIPAASSLFLLGAAFAWFALIPSAIEFLENFMPDLFQSQWSSREYVPFILSLVLWIGISFEMPLVLMFLAWMGLVTPAILLRGWRIAVVIIAIVAAAITPTVDPFNMGMVMAPLLLLYLLSILLSIFPYQARRRRAAQSGA